VNPYPFERSSEDGKRVLMLAQEEAERSHQGYIGTEHLLLGLLRLQSGTAFTVLTAMGVAIEQVREMVKARLGLSEHIYQPTIPTSRVKRVIETAFEQARGMRSSQVDTGHLLLGLVIDEGGVAAQALADLGATRERVVAAVEQELSGGGPGTARHPSPSGIDPQLFREVMGTFPSGVVVVTAFGDDGLPRGLTVNAFCAVSLDPPLALACIAKTSNTLPAVQHTRGFTANVLASGREALARRMATKVSDKFDGLAWRRAEGGAGGPILDEDAAAYAVCTLKDIIEAGDHWILIGAVVEGDHRVGVKPLVYSRRVYHDL
jgi:flavin reductase (DIM6/NTAB) family NADH-FMN oxidoreductase RutF